MTFGEWMKSDNLGTGVRLIATVPNGCTYDYYVDEEDLERM